jgi:PAS domain S-box-containing protein
VIAAADGGKLRAGRIAPETGVGDLSAPGPIAYIADMGGVPPDARDLLAEVLTESRDYAVVLVDAAGRIEGWTGSAPRLFGYSTDEAIGQDFAILFVPEDVALGLHRQEMALAATNSRSEDDRWHVRKDGSRFWGSGVLQALRNGEARPLRYCKLVRDRSDVRTRTEALENEVDRLAAELRRRTEATVAIVHELRAPLTPISAAADVLGFSQDPVARARSVEILRRQIGVLTRHVEDLYDVSRASLGTIRLEVGSVVVNDVLQAVVGDAAPAAAAKKVSVQLVLPSQPITIEADPQRLQQMVQNLLANAIKYTQADGRVVVSATVEGRDVAIRVEDNGAGIEPDVLPRMFELFTREDRSDEKSWPPGLGVGLALVKSLADLHRGTVEARSLGHDKGSVFSLRLPLSQPPGNK